MRPAQHWIGDVSMLGSSGSPVERGAGIRLGCPILIMLLASSEGCAEDLRHLTVHQQRQAHAEACAQLRGKCEESSQGGPRRIAVTCVENLADHRLFVSHKGIAG